MLSPLLFIIVLEALSRDFRVGLPWELLYADGLVLIADSLRGAEVKFRKWREGMASKGLRVNTVLIKQRFYTVARIVELSGRRRQL